MKDVNPTPQELDNGETELRSATGLLAVVEGAMQKREEQITEKFLQEISKLTEVDRSDVPEIVNKQGETVTRVTSPYDPMYRKLSDDERTWRNADSDHWMAEWIRAQWDPEQGGRNPQRALVAAAKLEEIFGRATTEEGAEGANFALSAGTGGALIPRPIEALVMIERDRVAKMRRFATIYNLTRQQHGIPTAGSMSASMVAEGSTASQGEPTFGSIPLVARKGQVRAVASVEMLADSAFNLVQIYATRAGGAIGVLEDSQFFADGDGSAPNINAALARGSTETLTTNDLAYSNMLGIFYGVAQEYRSGAVWFAPADVLQLLSNVRDATNSRPLYQGLLERPATITDDGDQVGTIFNKPVYEVPLPAGDIWFGNARAAYAVGNRQGITTAASEHAGWTSDTVEWKFTVRFAGNNVDADASRGATGINTASGA